jgi:hypothetical protein
VRFLNIECGLRGEDGKEALVSVVFKKHTDNVSGRHTTSAAVRIFDAVSKSWLVRAVEFARLGKSDVGRYYFFAGARIAFARVLDKLVGFGYDEPFTRKLRHAVQLQLALVENDERGQYTYKQLLRLRDQRTALLNEKDALMAPARRIAIEEVLLALAGKRDPFHINEPDTWAPHGRGCGSEFGQSPVLDEDATKAAENAARFAAANAHLDALDAEDVPAEPVTDFPAPECAECKGDPTCCSKHGGIA